MNGPPPPRSRPCPLEQLKALADALLDSQGAADQSVRQIRQHLKPCPAAQAAGLLVACHPSHTNP